MNLSISYPKPYVPFNSKIITFGNAPNPDFKDLDTTGKIITEALPPNLKDELTPVITKLLEDLKKTGIYIKYESKPASSSLFPSVAGFRLDLTDERGQKLWEYDGTLATAKPKKYGNVSQEFADLLDSYYFKRLSSDYKNAYHLTPTLNSEIMQKLRKLLH